jgi:hypothetical protein
MSPTLKLLQHLKNEWSHGISLRSYNASQEEEDEDDDDDEEEEEEEEEGGVSLKPSE